MRAFAALVLALAAAGSAGCASGRGGAGTPEPEPAQTRASGVAATTASSATTRILAIGDFGVGGERQRTFGAAIRRFERFYPAGLLVTLGDNDYTESPTAFRANLRASFGWLADAGVRVAGSLGNHDVRVNGGRYQFASLGMPSPYYTRRGGPVQIFVLDSNDVSAAQTTWLEEQLAASGAPWKIAVLHHPPFNCGEHTPAVDVQTTWVPLFEEHGVRLVLAGHDHNYQRFAERNGVTYVVHGGGGARAYGVGSCPAGHPSLAVGRKTLGFAVVVATAERLRVSAVTTRNVVRDRFSIYP